MDPMMPIAAILARDGVAQQVLSARPDAPVVPDDVPRTRPPRAARTRGALARTLQRAARAVEPAPRCTPAH